MSKGEPLGAQLPAGASSPVKQVYVFSKLMDSEKIESEEIKTSGQASSHLATDESNRVGRDITAMTIGRMMGLATVQELNLVETKIDMMVTKVNNLTVRMEKVLSALTNVPSGSDLERIDVHIGDLRKLIKDVLGDKVGDTPSKKGDTAAKPATKIITNNAPEEK